MPAFSDPSLPEELPPPSAELAMIRIIVESYLATVPRKRALRQLRLVAEKLTEAAEGDANVLAFRMRNDRETSMAARRQALAWFREVLPVWMSALDTE